MNTIADNGRQLKKNFTTCPCYLLCSICASVSFLLGATCKSLNAIAQSGPKYTQNDSVLGNSPVREGELRA